MAPPGGQNLNLCLVAPPGGYLIAQPKLELDLLELELGLGRLLVAKFGTNFSCTLYQKNMELLLVLPPRGQI